MSPLTVMALPITMLLEMKESSLQKATQFVSEEYHQKQVIMPRTQCLHTRHATSPEFMVQPLQVEMLYTSIPMGS